MNNSTDYYKALKSKKYLPTWYPALDKTELIEYSYLIFKTINELEIYRTTTDNKNYQSKIALENRHLNRYCDILPFDLTAVPLLNPKGYINASFMSSIGNHKQYIATQGPLPDTFNHFWQLIWETKVEQIAMLTTETEKGRIKCHKYWPSETTKYNAISVTLLNESKIMNGLAIKRIFRLEFNESRLVEMIQFLDWPDHKSSNPKAVLELIDLIQQDRERLKSTAPLLVHCSAGVGRTGTFCTIESVLHHIRYVDPGVFVHGNKPYTEGLEDYESVLSLDLVALTINHFRKQRAVSVQSASQVELCYEAILIKLLEWQKEALLINF